MASETALGVERRVVVPPREGRAVRLPRGRRFRVVDLEGHQCGDLFAYVASDVGEYASAEHTRVHVDRLFPRPGEHFVTNRRRPILAFEADDSPGVHDMLIAACDPARYEGLGVTRAPCVLPGEPRAGDGATSATTTSRCRSRSTSSRTSASGRSASCCGAPP